MSLPYYNAVLNTSDSPSNLWKDDFQAFVDSEFENASDYYTIQKENNLNELENLGVRLVAPYKIGASSTMRDDFKNIIFPTYTTNVIIGERYYFDGYWWITIDTGNVKSSSASCLVQRCYDFLRFYDDLGIYHEIPAVVSKGGFYDLDADKMMQLPNNQLRILIKYDNESKLIKWADVDSVDSKYTRFILNGQAFRTVSSDPHSMVRLGVGVLELRLQADQIRATDNLVDGIADDDDALTLLIQNGSTLNLGEGQTVQINSEVTLNDVVLGNPTITYASSNTNIATVNSSGLVTAITSGSVNITATYSTASDSIDITVSAVVADNYTVDIVSSNGIIDGIKLGQTISYQSYSKNNGSPYATVGTWSVLKDDGITPIDSAIISVLSNVGNVLSIKCASNSANVGTYFKVRYQDANASEIIRIRINSIF